ncbi:thiamine phosphate synthase [Deltaproteobacteria bacterium Smac51]|nr:thiamine phosphate synthase [Deltaproteobacteria bacterium Smac51]
MSAGRERLEEGLRLMLVISRGEAAPRTPAELAKLAFAGGATSLQLREKHLTDHELYQEALALRQLCRERDKMFVINDRLDLALAVDADFLHLGQKDLPAAVAARLWPRHKFLGVSVNTLDQAKAALEAGADYLGVGAVFPTGSKDDAVLMAKEAVDSIVALGAPTIAIGGISVANAASAWGMGVNGLAVISALAGADDPQMAASKLIAAAALTKTP